MKIKFIALAAVALSIITACSKDSFSTTPHLTFNSVSTQLLQQGGVIVFRLDYTDKDGDITGIKDSSSYEDTLGGAVYYEKVTSNCPASNGSGWYNLPQDFVPSSNSKGTIELTFGYGTSSGAVGINQPQCQGQNDTCVFKFVLKDKAGHRSDTVTSPQIVLLKI